MDSAAWVALIAAAISVTTFGLQFFLMRRQVSIAQQDVDAAAFVDLMNAFRQQSFHRHYNFVTGELRSKYDPLNAVPLFDIDGEDGAAVLDIVYFFQNCAAFADFKIVSEEKMMAFLHLRFSHVWEAVEPYVEAERARLGFKVLSALESYAKEARRRSQYEVHKDMLRSSKHFDPTPHRLPN